MTFASKFGGLLLACLGSAAAQHIPGYNYDESKVPPYRVIDPLTMTNGQPVRTPAEWWERRRPEIVRLFEENTFGRVPKTAEGLPLRVEVIERDQPALDGRARRTQVDLALAPQGTEGPRMHLLLYLPAKSKRPVRVILGLNFMGNHTVSTDPGIRLSSTWAKDKSVTLPSAVVPAESTRGAQAERWQVNTILDRGYGLATAYYGDIEPDYKGAGELGVRHIYGGAEKPDGWGALAAWAWGLSRAIDYLQTVKGVDGRGVVVTGHSRLGKAADWAAARDPRIMAVLSNESGKGGQSLYRRELGETIGHLEQSFPYWFCPNYAQWVDRAKEIPVDGNLLLSLIAPRPVYVASAVGDEWSDPRGEFESAVSASRVYALLGKHGIPAASMPGVDAPLGADDVAYHVRSGKHDVTAFDWSKYLDFLDRRFGGQH